MAKCVFSSGNGMAKCLLLAVLSVLIFVCKATPIAIERSMQESNDLLQDGNSHTINKRAPSFECNANTNNNFLKMKIKDNNVKERYLFVKDGRIVVEEVSTEVNTPEVANVSFLDCGIGITNNTKLLYVGTSYFTSNDSSLALRNDPDGSPVNSSFDVSRTDDRLFDFMTVANAGSNNRYWLNHRKSSKYLSVADSIVTLIDDKADATEIQMDEH